MRLNAQSVCASFLDIDEMGIRLDFSMTSSVPQKWRPVNIAAPPPKSGEVMASPGSYAYICCTHLKLVILQSQLCYTTIIVMLHISS